MTATPRVRQRLRLRRVAIAAVFVTGIVATVADEPAITTVPVPTTVATLHLDQGNPTGLTRIVVRLNTEATSGSSYGSGAGFALTIDAVRVAGGGPGTTPTGGAVGPGRATPTPIGGLPSPSANRSVSAAARFLVTLITPGAPPSASASAQPMAGNAESPWQAEVVAGRTVTLPTNCGIGPCERGFWLIAELVDPAVASIDVDWQVGGSLNYMGNAWPSGATGTVEIGTPVLLAGPGPELTASSDTDSVTLGPTRPAAARVVEVTIGAAAIPAGGGPVAALSVAMAPHGGGSLFGAAVIEVYPLGETDAGSAAPSPDGASPGTATASPGDAGLPSVGPAPSPAPQDMDPFAGCRPGVDCTRRVLVTFASTGSPTEDVAYDWHVTVRRLDLVNVWTTPAAMSATVTRRLDVAAASKPSVVHLEGDVTPVGTGPSPQVLLMLSTRTTSTDPLAGLLPVPGTMTYRAQASGPQPSAVADQTRASVEISAQDGQGGTMQWNGDLQGAGVTVSGYPMTSASGAGCRIGQSCPAIGASIHPYAPGGQSAPSVSFHWSLDVSVYSYTDVPITVQGRQLTT